MKISRDRKVYVAKCAVVLAVLPALIWAFAEGPDPRKTGAPGDGICSEAGCHVGTPNTGGGNVQITFPGGMTYTPGVRQRLLVRVNDSVGRVFGFQAAARLQSNERSAQAGTFSPADTLTQVLCEDGRVKTATGTCPAQFQIESVEHSRAPTTNTFSFDWTPPSTDQGNVRIYVAANAGNNNGQADAGDRIYTANYTLTPMAGSGPRPTISSGGVVDPFIRRSGPITSGSWLEIYGTNLSPTTRDWGGAFNGNNAPTSLDGVSVNVDGRPAFVNLISPGQVNVQVPDSNTVAGQVTLEVVTPTGRSDPFTITKAATAPILLAGPQFLIGGTQYLVAHHTDLVTFVGRPNLIAGAAFRPAQPGDTVIFYGLGFGPTNPASPPGVIVTQLARVTLQFRVRFGNTEATVAYAGMYPNFIGLYRFDVVVPNVADGDHQINIDLNNVPVNQTVFLTVQR